MINWNLCAQDLQPIPSKKEKVHVVADTTTINTLLESIKLYYRNDPQRALIECKKALDLSKELDYQIGVGKVFFRYGRIYSTLSIKDSALHYYELALEGYKQVEYKKGIAQSENSLGKELILSGEYVLALKHCNRAVSIYTETQSSVGLGISLGNIGVIFYEIGDFYKAIEYYLQSLELSNEIGDSIGMAYNSGNIGLLFSKLKEYDLAKEYLERSHTLFNHLKDNSNKANAIINLGDVYFKLDKYDDAIKCFLQAEETYREINNSSGLALCYNNISSIYHVREEKQFCLQYAKRAFKLYADVDEIKNNSHVFSTLAKAYHLKQDYDSALQVLNEGLALLADGDNNVDLMKFYRSFHEIYEKEGEYLKSSIYLHKYNALNDSIFNAKSNRQIHDLHSSYLYEKKDDENHFLKTEQKLKDKLLGRIQYQRYFLSMSALGLFLIVILFGFLFAKGKVYGKEIERSNDQIQFATKKLEKANEKLFISQADIGMVNEELKNLNDDYKIKIRDRSSVIIKSRYVMANILEISSDYLYESLKKINYVSEEVSSYGKKKGEKSLKKVLNIINRSDELFGHLIELREIAKRNVIIEKINCEDLMRDTWSDLKKVHDLDILVPEYKNVNSHFDSDYILSRALVYNILDYVFVKSTPKKPDIAMSFRSERSTFYIDILVKGQLQIPFRMKKSLSYLFQQAQDGSKDQIVLYMIKIALEKLDGKIDFSNSSIDDSVVSIKLPFPGA